MTASNVQNKFDLPFFIVSVHISVVVAFPPIMSNYRLTPTAYQHDVCCRSFLVTNLLFDIDWQIAFASEGKEESKLKVENANVVEMIKKWYLGGTRGISPSTISCLAKNLSAELSK